MDEAFRPLEGGSCIKARNWCPVTLQNDDEDPICFMQFDLPWLDRLSILRRGNRLTVIGQITTVENYGVTLDPCLASQLGSLAMLLAIRLASFLNDTDRS